MSIQYNSWYEWIDGNYSTLLKKKSNFEDKISFSLSSSVSNSAKVLLVFDTKLGTLTEAITFIKNEGLWNGFEIKLQPQFLYGVLIEQNYDYQSKELDLVFNEDNVRLLTKFLNIPLHYGWKETILSNKNGLISIIFSFFHEEMKNAFIEKPVYPPEELDIPLLPRLFYRINMKYLHLLDTLKIRKITREELVIKPIHAFF